MNDIISFPFEGWNPAGYEQALRDEFDQLYDEGADRRRMMVISLHDRISGHAGRVRALDRFLAYAKSKSGVHSDTDAACVLVCAQGYRHLSDGADITAFVQLQKKNRLLVDRMPTLQYPARSTGVRSGPDNLLELLSAATISWRSAYELWNAFSSQVESSNCRSVEPALNQSSHFEKAEHAGE